jgi:hypothetical protein
MPTAAVGRRWHSALRFQLHDSRFRGQSLAGSGEVDLAGERLRKADVELNAAGNRLTAKGAFGARGDRLTVSISAPRLDPLGVAGNLNGTLLLGGTMKSHLKCRPICVRRAWRGKTSARSAGSIFRPASGTARTAHCPASCSSAGLDLPDGNPLLGKAAAGRRRRTQRTPLARPNCPARKARSAAAARRGAEDSGERHGVERRAQRTERFVAAQQGQALCPPRRAACPCRRPPSASAPARQSSSGRRGRRASSGFFYEGQRWQTAGSLRGLPLVATLAEFPEWFDDSAIGAAKGSGEALRLNAEWDLGNSGDSRASGQRKVAKSSLPTGRLRLWRESGDLSIGVVPLGLTEGVVSLLAKDGRLDAELSLRGKKLVS